MNIELTYLYRDAANYKNWGTVVFSNTQDMTLSDIESAARRGAIDGAWFVAQDVGLLDLRPEDWDDEIDHDWHELHSLSETDAEADDPRRRDVTEFLRALRASLPAPLS